MTDIAIAWWPVVIATALRMVIGTIWFSPIAFVRPWQKLSGVTPEAMQQGLPKAIIVDFVMSFILSYALFRFVVYAEAFTWWGGALIGLLAWAGFVLATHLPLWAYENRNLKLIAIGAGSNLVSMVLMGVFFAFFH